MTRPTIETMEDLDFIIGLTRSEKLDLVKDKLRDYRPLSRLEQAWLIDETNVLGIELKRAAHRPRTLYRGVADAVDELMSSGTKKKRTAYEEVGARIGRSWQIVEKAYLAEIKGKRRAPPKK